LCTLLDEALHHDERHAASLHQMVGLALWGNQADLSLWPAADEDDDEVEEADGDADETQRREEHLLVDDRPAAVDHLQRADGKARVDIILDNAGLELVGDLCLVDLLLSAGWAEAVHLHAKLHPTFVSDAVVKDVQETIQFLAAEPTTVVQQLGQRLEDNLAADRLHVHFHAFWTSPLPMWEMSADLQAQLQPAHLVVSKGDANYRRLLGDRHWPFTTPFATLAAHLPAPILALRTCKSEVVVGLTSDQPAALTARDSDWLVNGEWGVMQFGKPD
jgi:uncharacterized protein with ATP-grasp and redox domains